MSVNDIRVKMIPIQLDKERHLKFDLNAFAELEELYGDFQTAMDAMSKGSIKAIRAMLWAGLIHEDEKLTIKQVGSMIDMTNINEIVSAISKAISEAMPKVDDEEKNA
ncbi:hypothetical protein [Caloramator sp. Dgby_cultured_2]|uniref:hypothetical protein n=1 Tax=Caloramator sp. Dgby_cultured_2 TaxID=3029174 RepID=UPI00237D99AF|nr:hypothetical protein [Caloramator sp. Dgby_cultured_2]WDU84207.1 hypothetical protein PWK10_07770 [Caloramator sp. Dgby_cultured_2]